MNSLRHFDAETVAAYAERRLNPSDRARFEDHLATCARCRGEVVEVRRILDARRNSSLRRSWALAAAASAILLVALPSTRDGGEIQTDSGPTLRRSFPVQGIPVETLVPETDEAVGEGARLRFVWRATGKGSTFRMTLLDEEGNLVWSTRTDDTTAAVPEGLRLESGETYYWYVDALSPDGRSVTSGPRRFRVR